MRIEDTDDIRPPLTVSTLDSATGARVVTSWDPVSHGFSGALAEDAEIQWIYNRQIELARGFSAKADPETEVGALASIVSAAGPGSDWFLEDGSDAMICRALAGFVLAGYLEAADRILDDDDAVGGADGE